MTHENLLAMANKMQRWLKLTYADRSARIMPIDYTAMLLVSLALMLNAMRRKTSRPPNARPARSLLGSTA